VAVDHTELLDEWRQLDSDLQLLLQRTQSATFNATDELKVDLLQSTLNLTPTNWVTGSTTSHDSCHVQQMSDDSESINRQVYERVYPLYLPIGA